MQQLAGSGLEPQGAAKNAAFRKLNTGLIGWCFGLPAEFRRPEQPALSKRRGSSQGNPSPSQPFAQITLGSSTDSSPMRR